MRSIRHVWWAFVNSPGRRAELVQTCQELDFRDDEMTIYLVGDCFRKYDLIR